MCVITLAHLFIFSLGLGLKRLGAAEMAELVKCLPHKHKDLSLGTQDRLKARSVALIPSTQEGGGRLGLLASQSSQADEL